MATDARGHTIPTGSDFAQRKSLTNLSLSIGDIKTCQSKAAATLYVSTITSALSAAGLPPISADNGLYVWRSDLQVLMRYDGAAWRIVAVGQDPATTLKTFTGTAALSTSGETFLVAVNPGASMQRCLVHYSCRIRPDGNAAGDVFIWDGVRELPGSRIPWHSDGTNRDQFVSGTVVLTPNPGQDIGLYASSLGTGSTSATASRATLQLSAY